MDVVMPQLGETVAEGKVSAWFKAPGDSVAVGENLFEIETDKVTMEVQALTSGILSEIRVEQGATVPVGAIVAVIGETEAVALSGAPDDAPGKLAAPPPSPLRGGARGGVAPSLGGNGAAAPFQLAPFAETNTPTGSFGKAEAFGMKV